MTTTTSPAPTSLLRLAPRLDAGGTGAHRATAPPARPPVLRRALRVGAVVAGAGGAAYLLAAPLLADLLGLPAGWLRGVGAFLLLFGGAGWAAAARPRRAPAQA